MLLERQTFLIWQTLFDSRMPVLPGMELSPPTSTTLFWILPPKSLSPFCLGSPYFNMQQYPLSGVSARQKFLPWAVFEGIISCLGRDLPFLCCPKQSGESEDCAVRVMLHFKSKSNSRAKIRLERKKQVGNIHSKHESCLSSAVNAAVASTSLGRFLPALQLWQLLFC